MAVGLILDRPSRSTPGAESGRLWRGGMGRGFYKIPSAWPGKQNGTRSPSPSPPISPTAGLLYSCLLPLLRGSSTGLLIMLWSVCHDQYWGRGVRVGDGRCRLWVVCYSFVSMVERIFWPWSLFFSICLNIRRTNILLGFDSNMWKSYDASLPWNRLWNCSFTDTKVVNNIFIIFIG